MTATFKFETSSLAQHVETAMGPMVLEIDMAPMLGSHTYLELHRVCLIRSRTDGAASDANDEGFSAPH